VRRIAETNRSRLPILSSTQKNQSSPRTLKALKLLLLLLKNQLATAHPLTTKVVANPLPHFSTQPFREKFSEKEPRRRRRRRRRREL
jgi:hypothetical protein